MHAEDRAERLQNVLARAGVSSRRGAAELIRSGRVTVGGILISEPGYRVDPVATRICVDGRPVAAAERKLTIVMNKPAGVLSTMSDPFGGRTVADLIKGKIAERLVPVGRLDKDSEGLLLMSNDGELTLQLTHPRYEHEKKYIVRAAGKWNESKLKILRSAVKMPDGYEIRPCKVRVLKGADLPLKDDEWAREEPNVTTLEFILHEGRKRQIRYMCSAAHLVVLSLKRVAIGSFQLPPELAIGEWRELTAEEIERLRR